MLHSLFEAGRDPLSQQLLPTDDSATSAAEEDTETDGNHQHRPTDIINGGSDAVGSLLSSPWGVMGSLLGRLTRSSSTTTSSSGNSSDQPCTLISVDRLQGQSCRTTNSEYLAPIVGYEVMEERARFTVFKVLVQHQASGRHWFVFRRYTDFARLNRKLRNDYRGLRFALPPKRWFGDNFDPMFLEDRLLGLQAFVDNIIAHTDISKCPPVKEFFCLDDPPGPDDSLEESKALCENLEDAVIHLQEVVRQRDREIDLLKSEVSMLKVQQQALLKSLKLQSRLASVACAQMQDEQTKMDSNQSKQFLTHMQKVNQFNIALAKTIDRSMHKSSSISDLGSKLSLSKVEEESSSLMATTTSIFEKAASMDDICSRSTGDGSTGSQERLPPLGEVSQDPNPEAVSTNTRLCASENQPDCHKNNTRRTIYISDSSVKSNLPIMSSEVCGSPPCLRDLQLNSVSFKKLLENNPELTENGLPSAGLLKHTVVPLSSIPVAGT